MKDQIDDLDALGADDAPAEDFARLFVMYQYRCDGGHEVTLPTESYMLLGFALGDYQIQIRQCPICFGEWLKGVLADARVPELQRVETDDSGPA